MAGPKLPLQAYVGLCTTGCLRPRCILATLLGKIDGLQFSLLRVHIVTEKSARPHAWLCNLAQVEPLEAAIMNPRRFATVAAGASPPAVLACWVGCRVCRAR